MPTTPGPSASSLSDLYASPVQTSSSSAYADSLAQQPAAPVTTSMAVAQGMGAPAQFGPEGQATGVADSICGPVAAIAFARATGRNPTIAEAVDIARKNGRWDAGTGMHGPAAEAALLTDMGVANRLEPNPSEGAVIRDVATGNPVILSSPGHYHYFVVTGYDPKTQLFDTGETGRVFKNNPHRYWSWAELGPQAALFIDEPTSPVPSTAADMSPQQGTPQQATSTTGGSIESYVRQAAAKYGIDPDTAVAVANAEGGLDSWNRQSDYVYKGKREESYGPFQLFMGGGLGDTFQAETGLDPRDPANGPAATDWALRYASKHGWADWHGAQRIGLDNMAGIGGKPSGVAPGGEQMGRANDSPFAPAETAYAPNNSGGREPIPPSTDPNTTDPWASVWDALKGAQQEVGQIGKGAADMLNAASDTATNALNTAGAPLIDPNTYTQSVGQAGDVASQSAQATNDALLQQYHDSPARTAAGVARWVRTGDTSGLDDPLQRALALLPGGSAMNAFGVENAATQPLREVGVGGALALGIPQEAARVALAPLGASGLIQPPVPTLPDVQGAQARFRALPPIVQGSVNMVLDPANLIGAGPTTRAVGRGVEGAAAEAGRIGEGVGVPAASGISGRTARLLGQEGTARELGIAGGADVAPVLARDAHAFDFGGGVHIRVAGNGDKHLFQGDTWLGQLPADPAAAHAIAIENGGAARAGQPLPGAAPQAAPQPAPIPEPAAPVAGGAAGPWQQPRTAWVDRTVQARIDASPLHSPLRNPDRRAGLIAAAEAEHVERVQEAVLSGKITPDQVAADYPNILDDLEARGRRYLEMGRQTPEPVRPKGRGKQAASLATQSGPNQFTRIGEATLARVEQLRAEAASRPAAVPEPLPAPEAAPPSEPPPAPPTTAASEPARPGFAGRLNISKFPPAVQDALRAAHAADPAGFEAAARGTITDPELERLAAEVDIQPILDKWKPGTVWTAEEQRAARIAVAKTFEDLRAAGAAPDSTEGTQALALAVQRAKAVLGVGSEAGRLLRQQRGSVEADALLNWRAAASGGVEDAFGRVNGVHDQVEAIIRQLPEGQQARPLALLDDAKAAADEGYQAAKNGVADHPTTGAPETRVEGQQAAPPPEAAPEPVSAGEGAPTPERAPVDANGKPLTRRQQTALEREKIRQEFALARFGKRAEELTARQKQIVDGATAREALRQERIGQSERLSADYKAQLEAQKQAAKDARAATSERLKLEQRREAAKDSFKAQQERARIAAENAQQRALRAAEDRHAQAMVKLFDAISDPARRNLVRQLVGTLGGKNSNLTPWQQAARAIRVAQRGRSITPDQQQQLYKNLIKAVTGTDDQTVAAQRMQQLRRIVQSGDTTAMGRLLQEANRPSFWENVQGYYAANLLTGPATHVRNVLGNLVSMGSGPLEHAIATPIEAGLSVLGRRPRERFMGEIPQELNGWAQAFPEAAARFGAIMRYGFDPANMERLANVRGESTIPIAKYGINTIFRGLGGMDAFFGHMVNQGTIRSLAYRQARMEGLKGDALLQRVTDLIDVPPVNIMEEARRIARYRTFHQEMEGLGKGLTDLARAFPPFRLVMPFIQTPYNIIKYDLERSPLGLGGIATDALKGRYNPASKRALEDPEQLKALGDLSDRLSRFVLGTVVLGTGATLYADDNLTGNGPTDPGQRDLWLRDHQPNSFRVGGHWVSWQNLPGVSTNLGVLTGVMDAQRYGKGDVGEQAAGGAVGAMRAITQRSFLQGFANLVEAVAPGGGGATMAGRYVSNTASGFIPASALLRRTAQGLDNEVKQPIGAVQQFTQNLPILSRGVQPRLDRSGRPITRETGGLLGSLFSPAQIDTATTDPTSLQAEAQGQAFPGTGSTLAGQSLTPEQQYRYQQVRGQLVTARRTALYASQAYKGADPATQQRYVDLSDNQASAEARDQVMSELGIGGRNPDEPPKYDPAQPWVQRLMRESNSADVDALAHAIGRAASTPLKSRTPLQRKLAYYAQYATPEWRKWSTAQKQQAGAMQGVVRGLATATP